MLGVLCGRRDEARNPSVAATIPIATPTSVSTKRRIGSCQASCGLYAATTITTAVVMAVVTTRSSRPITISTNVPIPISAASPNG